MTNRGNAEADALHAAGQDAVPDHHLDEVAEMIEQAQLDKRSPETQSDDVLAEYLR